MKNKRKQSIARRCKNITEKPVTIYLINFTKNGYEQVKRFRIDVYKFYWQKKYTYYF